MSAQSSLVKHIYKESDDYEAYLLDREEYYRTMVDSFGVQAAAEAGLKAHFREFSTAHKSVGNGMTRAEFQESPTHWQEFESTISLIPEVSDWTDIGPSSQPDETGLSGVGDGELGVGPVDLASLDLYPNPTDGQVTLSYTMDRVFKTLELRVVDGTGREVYRQILTNAQNQVLLTLSLTAANYQVQLIADGTQVDIEKLIIK